MFCEQIEIDTDQEDRRELVCFAANRPLCYFSLNALEKVLNINARPAHNSGSRVDAKSE